MEKVSFLSPELGNFGGSWLNQRHWLSDDSLNRGRNSRFFNGEIAIDGPLEESRRSMPRVVGRWCK